MAKNISFMQYMRAHGNTPGPTQRPFLTGAVSGALAEMACVGVLYYSNALVGVAERSGLELWVIFAIHAGVMVFAGMLYAAVFKRAANDRWGGWLFGAAFGFLLWMFAPATLFQLFARRPVVVGTAAIGFFAAHILYGLVLGLLFPRIHTLVQRRLMKTREAGRMQMAEPERIITHRPKPEFVSRTAKIQAGKQ